MLAAVAVLTLAPPRAALPDSASNAELALGLLYDLGQQVRQDPGEALHWYLRAAEAGLPQAEFNVAAMLDGGIAAPRDAGLAALWYARAAAHGHARAQFDLAQLYAAGEGVPRNPAVAAAWYRAAAANGVEAAQSRVRFAEPETAAPLAAADPAPATLQVANGRASLELVWQAPPQPVPVVYDVEIAALDGAGPRDVFSARTDASAILASIPAVAGRYAWRVYAVSAARHSYQAAPWSRFTIGGS